jgi:hypothetical protein
MKEIIYIIDYSNTLEKQINLLNLIKDINREVYDVCVSSHCVLPEWIIELCDYYFYDKNNDLLYDPFIKPFKHYQNNIFNIKYKPINIKSAHILAILRLNYSTLTFLKSLGYDKIHQIEYDCKIKDFNEFKNNSQLLDTYDAVLYFQETFEYKNNNSINNPLWAYGSFCSFKLFSFTFEKLSYDRQKILDTLYIKNNKTFMIDTDPGAYSQEKTVYELFWKNKKIYKKPTTQLDPYFITNLHSSINSRFSDMSNNISIFKKDKKIWFYLNNLSNKTSYTQLIFDNYKIYNYSTLPFHWNLQSIKHIPIENIQLIHNGKTIKTYNMKDKFDIEYLTSTKLNFK